MIIAYVKKLLVALIIFLLPFFSQANEGGLFFQEDLEGLPVLKKTFFDFYEFRKQARADSKISRRTKAHGFVTFSEELKKYGLVPRDEKGCLYSLLGSGEKPSEDNSDPCFPKYGDPQYNVPSAWEHEEEESADSNGGLEGRVEINNRGGGGGGLGGGVGRSRGRGGR